MAHREHDRHTAYDYMYGDRSHYDEGAGISLAGLFIGLTVIAFVLFMLFAATDRTTTGDATHQTPPTTSTTPVAPITQPE